MKQGVEDCLGFLSSPFRFPHANQSLGTTLFVQPLLLLWGRGGFGGQDGDKLLKPLKQGTKAGN